MFPLYLLLLRKNYCIGNRAKCFLADMKEKAPKGFESPGAFIWASSGNPSSWLSPKG